MKEKLWRSLSPWIALAFGFVLMFVASAYLTPVLVGDPTRGDRHGVAQAVEIVSLFGGLLLGVAAGAVATGVMEKRLFSDQIRAKWRRQDQEELGSAPPLLRPVLKALDRLMGK